MKALISSTIFSYTILLIQILFSYLQFLVRLKSIHPSERMPCYINSLQKGINKLTKYLPL